MEFLRLGNKVFITDLETNVELFLEDEKRICDIMAIQGDCFDRKEVKDHGEGGLFVGKQLSDGERVIIVEDVMTSGKALREILPKLKASANVEIAGMVISVDRMERGLESSLSAVQEVYKEFGVKVYSIVTMADIIEAIEQGVIEGKEYLGKMKEYRKTYGVS